MWRTLYKHFDPSNRDKIAAAGANLPVGVADTIFRG